ncbi:DNA topoisomerase (ATP-hydrolyzing) subunit B [Candidatus Marinamargulisbacteria bacterium SCGC AG-439-L15]|nr:DNA topoisomerase (ATP-hydrolyzing) subunit B [Candidatus Marinamargulisbacteria bacterium SCGC AG-439-L15]
MTQKYDADQIKVLEGLEAVRKRPGMYIGTTGINGLNHLIYEVVDNSIDEAMAGYCTDVEVTIEPDNIVSVKDNGRGIPISIHKSNKLPAVEVVLTTLHAGGKFEGEGYKVSGGLHGVGVSVVNALSEWLEVTVHRDNQKYEQKYFRGKPENAMGDLSDCPQEKTGTVIRFKADHKIFDTLEYGGETIDHRLRELAYLNRGIRIHFKDLRDSENIIDNVYEFEGGIASYVESLTESKERLFTPPIYLKKTRETNEIEVSIQYVSDYYDENVVSFANNIRTKEGGTHLSGFRTALTRVMNAFAKKYDLIQKGKANPLTGNDLREGLTAVISVKLQNPQFEGQTKTKLGNSEIKGIVDSLLDEGLTDFVETNPKVGRLIVSKALAAQRVREAARKAQDLARRKSTLESTTLPGKLADCSDPNPENCEVFLVEGDSAGGSAKQGRDRNFQAILPLRGKVLNVEKARLDKILANEEIRSLITAVGPEAITGLSNATINTDKEEDDGQEEGLDVETTLKKLRYHKVVIMTDADVDGAHIRTLLLTFFFRYARALIEAGALYIAQPPLYLVKSGGKGTYAYNDEELEKVLSETGKDRDKINIQRYKGLGEMNPDQLWDTTLNPEKRTMLQVSIEDGEQADEIFTLLMGSKVDPRKAFIEKYGKTVRWIDV